jgi:methionyl aminopeptidase
VFRRTMARKADVQLRTSIEIGKALIAATRESLENTMAQGVREGCLGDVGWARQSTVEPRGFGFVRQFVGQGIGRAMHEEPDVPNDGDPGAGRRLSPGLVMPIEPTVRAGRPDLRVEDDGWTAVIEDGSFSTHFGYSVGVTEHGPIVLSQP